MSGDAEIFGRSLPSSAICGAVCRSVHVAGTDTWMRRVSSTITTDVAGSVVWPDTVVGTAPVEGGCAATVAGDEVVPGMVVLATIPAVAGAIPAAAVAATATDTTAAAIATYAALDLTGREPTSPGRDRRIARTRG